MEGIILLAWLVILCGPFDTLLTRNRVMSMPHALETVHSAELHGAHVVTLQTIEWFLLLICRAVRF